MKNFETWHLVFMICFISLGFAFEGCYCPVFLIQGAIFPSFSLMSESVSETGETYIGSKNSEGYADVSFQVKRKSWEVLQFFFSWANMLRKRILHVYWDCKKRAHDRLHRESNEILRKHNVLNSHASTLSLTNPIYRKATLRNHKWVIFISLCCSFSREV